MAASNDDIALRHSARQIRTETYSAADGEFVSSDTVMPDQDRVRMRQSTLTNKRALIERSDTFMTENPIHRSSTVWSNDDIINPVLMTNNSQM